MTRRRYLSTWLQRRVAGEGPLSAVWAVSVDPGPVAVSVSPDPGADPGPAPGAVSPRGFPTLPTTRASVMLT
eukprot:scaffold46760_cov39-Phaeocystis_antarctica.AAC.6